jgi:hypothetical protein
MANTDNKKKNEAEKAPKKSLFKKSAKNVPEKKKEEVKATEKVAESAKKKQAEAKKDAERALSGNSPIKMILYKMAEETHSEACDEYYKRCAMKGEG